VITAAFLMVAMAATVGGALAAGLEVQIGTIVAGARADLTVVSLDRLRPVASHIGAVVAYASAADVDTVVVDGILRKSGGELVGVDRAALVRDAEASRDRLLGLIGTSAEELRFSGRVAVPQQDQSYDRWYVASAPGGGDGHEPSEERGPPFVVHGA
jgi:hypothetical protein